MDEFIERVEEALGLLSMVVEDIENEDQRADLLEAIEILEDVTMDLGASQEMNEMLEQHLEDVERLEDF